MQYASLLYKDLFFPPIDYLDISQNCCPSISNTYPMQKCTHATLGA